MKLITLYHGSKDVIETPVFGKGRLHNDYGLGFYCTESLELAKEWAASDETRSGYANEYAFDATGLTVLDLSTYACSSLHWLALLLQNRIVDTRTAVAEEGRRYLAQEYAVDADEYDVIRGWRADDSYFSFARAFLQNEISLEQLTRCMRFGGLGEQVVLKSERSFDRIAFSGFEAVPSAIYFPKRLQRDSRARARFREEAERQGIQGLYIRDIIQQEMTPQDVIAYERALERADQS